MVYIPRTIETRWMDASKQFSVLLLTGARQVGKTTLVKNLCEPGRTVVSLDGFGLRSLAREDPALFLKRYSPPVFIADIQSAPELLPQIKIWVDRDRGPGMFWSTGSQQFQMMKGVTKSLAGRVAVVQLLGLSCREGEGRSLDHPAFLPAESATTSRKEAAGETDSADTFRKMWTGCFLALVTGGLWDRQNHLWQNSSG